MERTPVAIVGAGLAGLCCARHLTEAGVDCRLLEAADRVGGRIVTDRHEGFLLDRGFQVFLTSYPEAQRVLDYEALELAAFEPGALIRVGDRNRRVVDAWRRPLQAMATLFAPALPLTDVPRVLRLRRAALRGTGTAPAQSAAEYLATFGFSDRAIRRFFRPFFGGVTLDATLSVPSWFFQFLFEMFTRGQATLPARGMEAIPEQLAAGLPDGIVRLGTPVSRLGDGVVEFASGERLAADHTVVATDATHAASLVGDFEPPGSFGTTTLYYAAERSVLDEATLLLDGDQQGPVNHVCFPSDVQPSYAPEGAALASVSVLGVPAGDDRELESAVRAQLRRWFGAAVDDWQLLRIFRIPRALPMIGSERAAGVRRVAASVSLCGDHQMTPSIQGAMVAGRRAAESVIEQRGIGKSR